MFIHCKTLELILLHYPEYLLFLLIYRTIPYPNTLPIYTLSQYIDQNYTLSQYITEIYPILIHYRSIFPHSNKSKQYPQALFLTADVKCPK